MNSTVNNFMNKSLSSVLHESVGRGLELENQSKTPLNEPTLTQVILKPETEQFLNNQSATLKISKQDLINLILDSIAENTIKQQEKLPSKWSVF
ncbi:hypothetical protein [Aquirhabdus sp.]|uniref:hypothetical protein n=1 Tax=Aquirhabdus sp. TaxID=2824160 RepID=UPI00396C5D0A